ncbi:hypothetical protein [Rossellomorea aquimaris]|nr:hypothetical protein [Rossellomorea aquimaris]
MTELGVVVMTVGMTEDAVTGISCFLVTEEDVTAEMMMIVEDAAEEEMTMSWELKITVEEDQEENVAVALSNS